MCGWTEAKLSHYSQVATVFLELLQLLRITTPQRLTTHRGRNIVAAASLLVTTMSDDLLLSLETRLDRLILLCSRLQQENAELKTRESEWQRERVRLIEKNELARSRVEAMITHLKSLDAESGVNGE